MLTNTTEEINPHSSFSIGYTSEEITERMEHVVKNLSLTYSPYEPLVLIGVLTGGYKFFNDVSNYFTNHYQVELDFIKPSSYIDNKKTDLKVLYKPTTTLYGKHILLIDDINDSGDTLANITSLITSEYKPLSIRSLVLIERQLLYKTYFSDYKLFQDKTDDWFVGYGMDLNGKFRQLNNIYRGKL